MNDELKDSCFYFIVHRSYFRVRFLRMVNACFLLAFAGDFDVG